MDGVKKILFICTGNYYRSRFAEIYFRHLAGSGEWVADSRGLALSPNNVGPISPHLRSYFEQLGIRPESFRWPQPLQEEDLSGATRVIALKESEHRPMMQHYFPSWEARIEYWKIDDVDVAPPKTAIPAIMKCVENLVQTLSTHVDS